MAGLYIHIPFCESRCIYCGFYSTTSLKLRDDYVDALCREMQMRPSKAALGNDEPIETIYLGGGTPSQLKGSQLNQIFSAIRKNYTLTENIENIEITMECNPDDVTGDFCETLKQLPVNRISMGAQTFSNERLRFLHRRHNAREVDEAITRLRNIGIRNISIDLMFGFPEESLFQWMNDIRHAIQLNVEHISAYSLMYEEGTPLYHLLEQEKIREIEEETSRRMYETLIDLLTGAGYEHYEISNFARPGFRSRHNSSYWHEVPYIGIGAAAHSYNRKQRSWNIENIQTYIRSISEGILPSESEQLDITTRYNDLITTALRTSDGIDLMKMEQEFGKELADRLLQEAQPHISRRLMKIKDGRLSLTREGLYISDDVMSDFMIV
jgi:putative oxygen-independent coproporphyrinogen III oxidase